MNSQDYRNLQEAYLDVYEEITLKGTGPRLVDPYTDPNESKSGGKIKGPKMKNVIKKEETDLYDIILSHLLDEGYADTEQAAEAIMVNMSEEWRESIVVEGYEEIDREKHGRMYDRYKKLGTAAMKDDRETGEASGDNRFKMSKMMGVIDKSAENLRNKR